MNSSQLENLTQAKFGESLNTPFLLSVNSTETVELQLVEVTPGMAAAGGNQGSQRFESFSLMFRGGSRLLPQGAYSLKHAQLGDFLLFIVPVDREGDGFKYQAVINRHVQPA